MARGDSFLLDRLHPQGATEAGIYASSFRLLDAFNMVGFLFAGFLLPYIARHKDDRESVDSVMIACRNLLLLFTFISASFIIWAPWFVNSILYHQTNEYREWVLRLTIMNLPFLALIHIYGTALTATGHIKTYFRITIFFAIINFCANILLAGRYGAIACAAIACCTQLLFALTIIYFSLKKTRAPIQWFSLGKIVLAAIIFCLILGITGKYGWNPVFSGMIALLLTGLILLFTGTISIGRILKTVTEN
jgi:O-antigen/teichoic acid export membrane protein